MDKVREQKQKAGIHDQRSWRVVDDFAPAQPIGAAEVDALEAVLMSVVNTLHSDKRMPVKGQGKRAKLTACGDTGLRSVANVA